MSRPAVLHMRWSALSLLAAGLAALALWMVVATRAGAEPPPTQAAAVQDADLFGALGALHGTGGFIVATYADIEGESTRDAYEGWIEGLSFEWSAAIPEADSRSGQRNARPAVGGLVLSFHYETAAVALEQRMLTGTVIPSLEVQFVESAGDETRPLVIYELTNVRITDYLVTGEDATGVPHVSVSNTFESIKVTYVPDEGPDVEYEYTVGK